MRACVWRFVMPSLFLFSLAARTDDFLFGRDGFSFPPRDRTFSLLLLLLRQIQRAGRVVRDETSWHSKHCITNDHSRD